MILTSAIDDGKFLDSSFIFSVVARTVVVACDVVVVVACDVAFVSCDVAFDEVVACKEVFISSDGDVLRRTFAVKNVVKVDKSLMDSVATLFGSIHRVEKVRLA